MSFYVLPHEHFESVKFFGSLSDRMETFQDAGLQMLREFRALLQQTPLPLGCTRFLQLLALNMFAIENTQLKGRLKFSLNFVSQVFSSLEAPSLILTLMRIIVLSEMLNVLLRETLVRKVYLTFITSLEDLFFFQVQNEDLKRSSKISRSQFCRFGPFKKLKPSWTEAWGGGAIRAESQRDVPRYYEWWANHLDANDGNLRVTNIKN